MVADVLDKLRHTQEAVLNFRRVLPGGHIKHGLQPGVRTRTHYGRSNKTKHDDTYYYDAAAHILLAAERLK